MCELQLDMSCVFQRVGEERCQNRTHPVAVCGGGLGDLVLFVPAVDVLVKVEKVPAKGLVAASTDG